MRISIGMEEITRSAPESHVCQVPLLYFGFLPSGRRSVQRPETHSGAAYCWTSPEKCVFLCLCQARVWRWDVCVPGASKPGRPCKKSPCQFSFIKKIFLSMPKNNIVVKDNQLAMVLRNSARLHKIPDYSFLMHKQRIEGVSMTW